LGVPVAKTGENAFLQNNNTFFRLACTNQQGEKKYSNIIRLSIENKNGIKVYPVPAINIINIETQKTSGIIRIIDIFGHTLLEQKNRNFIEKINIASLAAGSYIVQFVHENTIQYSRFVKANE
jgi:Secretion system C-terminal sorting domain